MNMDFGGDEDCPFDTLGSDEGSICDAPVQPQPLVAAPPQQPEAHQAPHGAQANTPVAATTQQHNQLQRAAEDNPFAAESGDFTLSGDASLEATQNDDPNRRRSSLPTDIATPAVISPPQPLATIPPPADTASSATHNTQPSSSTASTPHTSVQRAAVGGAKVVPKVLAHNPFEAHNEGDYDPFGSDGNDEGFPSFDAGQQGSSAAPAGGQNTMQSAGQGTASFLQEQQHARTSHTWPAQSPPAQREQQPPPIATPTPTNQQPPQERYRDHHSHAQHGHQRHGPPQMPQMGPQQLPHVHSQPPAGGHPSASTVGGHHHSLLPPLPMQPIMPPGFGASMLRSSASASQTSLDGSQRQHPEQRSDDRWDGGASGSGYHHPQPQIGHTTNTTVAPHQPPPRQELSQPLQPPHASTSAMPVTAPQHQPVSAQPTEHSRITRGHERIQSEGSTPYQHAHHPAQLHNAVHTGGTGGVVPPQPRAAHHHLSFDAQRLVPRSDSAPTYLPPNQAMASHTFHHSINGHAHSLTPEQLAGGGVMQRAESQQFYDTTHHNNHHLHHHHHHAPAETISNADHRTPQPQYQPPTAAPGQQQHCVPHHAQQHYDPHAAHHHHHHHHSHFQPQQQHTPFQPEQPDSSFPMRPGYDTDRPSWMVSSSSAMPASGCNVVERLLAQRRNGFVGCFGLGGRLFYASSSASNHAAQGVKPPSLSGCSVSQLLTGPDATDSGRSYVKTLSSLPGCLTPSTKVDVVLKALAQVPNVSPVLVGMLHTMCTRPMDWAKGGQHELIKMLQSATIASGGGAEGTVPVYNEGAPQPFGQQEALATIQKLMTAGDRQEAVRCALHYKLHSHALLIAMMCDTKDVYQHVVSTIIKEQLDPRTPLASAYCAFNELPPPEVPAEMRESTLSQWPQHVAMLVANFTREAGESLLQLGDQLLDAGRYDCAHVCYLVAQLSPAARPGPQAPPKAIQVAEALRSRYLLLGGHYHRTRCRAALLQPHTVFLTEVLEFSRQRENEKFVRVQLIPFRVMMAELYAELGMSQHAESYHQHMGKLLPSSQPRKDDFATRNVAEVMDAIRKRTAAAQQAAHGSAGGAQKSAWWPFGGAKATGGAPASSIGGTKPTSAGATSANTISRASSVNPTTSSRSSSATSQPPMPPPPNTIQAPSVQPAPANPPTTEPDAKQPAEAKSRWGLGGLFRRGGSQPATTSAPKKLTAAEEKEAKAMIIDTEAPPTYDAATGRWLFQKSKEELAVDEQIRAGPPKMPTPTTPGTPIMPGANGPPMAGGPPLPQQPMGAGGPPPPPGFSAGPPGQRKYVDMFNS